MVQFRVLIGAQSNTDIMVGMVSDFSGKTYLDYAASTPVAHEVLAAMLPYFSDIFGNASSVHRYGQKAEAAIEVAREKVAKAIGCNPKEVVFTSGGTESNNLAIRGTALARRERTGANHILISPVEHPAALATARQLGTLHGFEVEMIPVTEFGEALPDVIEQRLRPTTALVSVIYGNNEIGTLNPLEEIGDRCQRAGVPLHTDAVQAAAHLPIDLRRLPVNLLSIGAHKFYGPKGVGALFIREGNDILPTQTGGGHEFGLRAGTSNTPLIVGLAEALTYTTETIIPNRHALSSLRDHLIQSVVETIPDSQLTGHPTLRLPNHASFVFQHVDGNELLMLLDASGFACSSGSACKSGNPEPSQVLLSLGLSPDWALGSLRITLGLETQEDDIDRLTNVLPALVESCRMMEQAS